MWKLKRRTSGCASNLLAHEDLGQFWGSPSLEYTSQVIKRRFPLAYGSDKARSSQSWRTWCYYEAQVWKKIVALSLLSFSLISFFIWALRPVFLFSFLFSFFVFGLFGLFFLFPHMGQCSNNDDHHTFIYSQLKDHNDDDSIGNASGSVPGCATI